MKVPLLAFASPAASIAQIAGEVGSGNVPISGVPAGPANVGGVNNVMVDPSGIANAAKIPSLPQPHIGVDHSAVQIKPETFQFARPARAVFFANANQASLYDGTLGRLASL